MEFLKISKPDIAIINLCISLANKINKFDNMDNPIFSLDDFRTIENHPIIYYATAEKQLIGFIGVSIIDETEIEICGFVLPEYRNLKVASHLLEMVFDDYEDFAIKIPLAYGNSLGQHFLKSYNAKCENTECIMELEKDNYHFLCDKIKLSTYEDNQSIIYKAYANNNEVGTASVLGKDTFVIHHVEIYEKYRGNKYGQSLLHSLLTHQFINNNKATLHVTKENLPAYNLYCKLGFKISKQLEYYSL